jgi:UDP-N-acetylglucosamine 1-carboxyvinyltransferase
MSTIQIEGGKPLQGTIKISGSKNSALKLIAAALFANEDVILENVPRMGNVLVDLEIIEALGGKVEWVRSNTLLINGAGINTYEIPFDLGSKYRTAALHAAALVFRFGKAVLPIPGGCKIGLRPMNRWVSTWESLGIEVTHDERNFYLEAQELRAANINFKINTHMGTDNAILYSMFIPGETTILNAAEEPEVDDLIELINLMGGDVERIEPRKIKVIGKNNFKGATFKVMSDRNEVVTFAVASLVTGGNITMRGMDRKTLLAFVNVLTKMGAKFDINEEEMRVWRSDETLEPVDITTAPYPGFMTDWQPLITLLLTQAEGSSLVHDTVYWDRFGYIKDLNRMGASIELFTPSEKGMEVVISEDTYDLEEKGEPETVAEIRGPTRLKGSKLLCPDLRAGATLVIAALAAEGKSELIGYENVTRGYEDFTPKLIDLGAEITVIE